jgi:hypothetical protein
VTTYASIVDEARLIWSEKRDWIAAYHTSAARGDRLALGHMAMDGINKHRLGTLAEIGKVLAAVAEAHQRDPAALAAVIGDPLAKPAEEGEAA